VTGDLLLVRHGQTAVNRAGRLQGRVDAPLTDFGRAQAGALAVVLASCGATEVVTSPLQRAADTAAVIADALGLAVHVDERLVELDYGEWDQRPFGDVDPDDWARWHQDDRFAPPGGESLRAVMHRAVDFAVDALARDTTIVAVSHVSPIKAIVAWAVGAPPTAAWRMHLDVAAMCRVAGRSDAPVLRQFNATVGP
jgi:probable phosphoglycerate mutase